jgi:TetR/AcrR family transcriptional repressor of nem operon
MPRTKQFDEDQVLEKAMNLFWQKGYHDTSIQDLVEHLGINRASMYHTFGDKQSLFIRALQRYRAKGLKWREGILKENEESPVQALRELFLATAGQLAKDRQCRGCFLVNSAAELLPAKGTIREYLDRTEQEELSIYCDCIARAVELGELPPETDVPQTATYLAGLHHGLTVVSKFRMKPQDLESMVRIGLEALSPN